MFTWTITQSKVSQYQVGKIDKEEQSNKHHLPGGLIRIAIKAGHYHPKGVLRNQKRNYSMKDSDGYRYPDPLFLRHIFLPIAPFLYLTLDSAFQ